MDILFSDEQLVRDILLYINHSDPQLRAQSAVLLGNLLHSSLLQSRFNFNDWCWELCQQQVQTGRLNVMPMWYRCDTHNVYMWCPCDIHAISMRCPFATHVIYMQYPWGVHVIPMWYTCNTYEVYMWHPCIHWLPMRCVCDTHVIYMHYP